MSTTRRDFLRGLGVTIAGLGVGAKIVLPDGREGEIESIETTDAGEVKAHVLLYWYCPECGAMNTQRQNRCRMCKTEFSEENTIIANLTHVKSDPWEGWH